MKASYKKGVLTRSVALLHFLHCDMHYPAVPRGLASIGSVGRSKCSTAEGWLKDGTTTAMKYTRKLRKTKDEHKRLKARAQNLSERVIAKVAECKQNKFAYSRSGLILSEGRVREAGAAEVKDQLRNAEHHEIRKRLRDTLVRSEHELAHLQQKLLHVQELTQQCSTLESHIRESNAKARTGRGDGNVEMG